MTTLKTKLHYLAVATFCVATTTPAAAQPKKPDNANPAIAEDLFRRGRERFKAGKISEACRLFEESLDAEFKLGTLLNVARCHAAEGKTATAWAEFVRAETLADRAGQEDRQKFAAENVAELETKLTRLRLVLAPETNPKSLSLDGKALGLVAAKTAFPVDPGQHTLNVIHTNGTAWSRVFVAPVGPATFEIRVPKAEPTPVAPNTLGSPPPATPAPTTGADEPKASGVDGAVVGSGIAALTVGAAALAVGAYFGVRTLNLKEESQAHCTGTVCNSTGVELVDEAFGTATISTAALIVGGVCAVTGVVLLSVGLSSGDVDEPAATLKLRATPGGAWLVGTF